MKDILRKKIIERFESSVDNARDCDLLAQTIQEQACRRISSTTLRRFFGLLNSETSLSGFNLDTLSIYCGCKDYKDFSKKYGNVRSAEDPAFSEILGEMEQLTWYAINSISKKSLTRFSQTIPRKEINANLDSFIESNYTIIPLIAPGGYGKSLGLAHWIKPLLDSKSSNLFFLFCQAPVFHKLLSGGVQSSEIINLNLANNNNILNKFSRSVADEDQKLILIIDGIDEMSPQTGKIKQLVDFITAATIQYHSKSFLKIILSVREVTWNKYLLPEFKKANPNWLQYSKTEFLEVGYSNVPMLSNTEVKNIIKLFNRTTENKIIYECIDWEMRKLLKIPLNLHFFNSMASVSHPFSSITSDQLIGEFVSMQVFKSSYNEEKIDIVWKIIELTWQNESDFSVRKNDLKEIYPIHFKKEADYYEAYQELLSLGILVEEKIENKYGLNVTWIRFGHVNLYYYMTATFLINHYGEVNPELLRFVCNGGKSLDWSTYVLAYIYQVAYKSEDYNGIKDYCDLPVELISSVPVRLAVGTCFRKPNAIREKLVKQFAAHPEGQVQFFERFVDTNYLYENFTDRITEYLKHKRNPEAMLFGHCILYLGSFLKMDIAGCNREYSMIMSVTPDSSIYPWPIGRMVSATLLQKYFIERKAIDDIDDLINQHRKIAYSYESYLANGVIEFEMYIMIALVLLERYESLISLIEIALESYRIHDPKHEGFSFMHQHQNQIPMHFLEYARYKCGNKMKNNFHLRWERALDNYASTFDDYQYLILLNFFLYDYYHTNGLTSNAMQYYQAAMDLASHAGYKFYTIYFQLKCPNGSFKNTEEAKKMLELTGFNPSCFGLHGTEIP